MSPVLPGPLLLPLLPEPQPLQKQPDPMTSLYMPLPHPNKRHLLSIQYRGAFGIYSLDCIFSLSSL